MTKVKTIVRTRNMKEALYCQSLFVLLTCASDKDRPNELFDDDEDDDDDGGFPD